VRYPCRGAVRRSGALPLFECAALGESPGRTSPVPSGAWSWVSTGTSLSADGTPSQPQGNVTAERESSLLTTFWSKSTSSSRRFQWAGLAPWDFEFLFFKVALYLPSSVDTGAGGAVRRGGAVRAQRSGGDASSAQCAPWRRCATLHPTPYTTHPTTYTLHPALYTPHPTPYTLNPTLFTLHPTPYTLHITTCNTLHTTLDTLHPSPYTLYHTLYTLHPTPYTLHPTPYTLHPTSYTLHPTPHTPHPTPCTLHPTPSPSPPRLAPPCAPRCSRKCHGRYARSPPFPWRLTTH